MSCLLCVAGEVVKLVALGLVGVIKAVLLENVVLVRVAVLNCVRVVNIVLRMSDLVVKDVVLV